MVIAPSLNSNDATQAMMDSARVGLDYIVENADYIEKLSSALESKNFVVKKQVFELLSALSVYSNDGYARTLQALEYFKNHTGGRYRFKFTVQELRNSPTVEYQTAVLAFINCLILATPDLRERIRVRSEFIGLKLLQALSDLRFRNKDYPDLLVQLDVFDEQKESDESQVSPNLNTIDLSSPLEVFDAILRQISDTPQEVPFLCLLQHLLRIDVKEPVSDLIWDAAERLVHRATLLESNDDALRLLKAPSHAKSLHKLKGPNGEKCSQCGCHKSERPEQSTGVTAVVPPPPPPPPVPCGGPPPPPLPPMGGMPPPPPPPMNGNSGKSDLRKDLPKLPQQSIPSPKAKMRTVNWNKIPSGQILSGDKNNLWATFAKKQNTNMALDWGTLEGLFCLQNEKLNMMGGIQGNSTVQRQSPVGDENEKRKVRREASEVTLLDAKRSLNINIFLKQFRSSFEEMIELILRGSSEDFGVERLRSLLKLLPTNDEIEMLNSVPEKDKLRLASAEKFLLQLIKLPGYRLRIEAMLLEEELDNCVSSIDSSITAILQAAQDVKTSEEFQEVIFMILVAGNFLNSGGYAGDAAGVKLTSLQKITDIRGNKPGISLLHFISMQAETRNPRLISFVNEMTALEDASKTSGEQLKGEILSLKTKVTNISQQLTNPATPKDVINQFDLFFQEATRQITSLESYLVQVEDVRYDLAQFFCEDLQSFKLEDCFKILFTFTTKWKAASLENSRRKKQEAEVEARKKTREEQLKKRTQVGWQNSNQLSADDALVNPDRNKGIALNPEDDIFIACSPRIVRRRLGSYCENNGNGTNNGQPGQSGADQLMLPSPDITPNGSLRRRRSRIPSEEDETGLMDFLRSSGSDGQRERRGTEQYGSLDRSWSRKTRRRPNLMDFVNDERERPVSPAPAHPDHKPPVNSSSKESAEARTTAPEQKNESPVREWRERITAWFVDLENGGSGEIPKRRPPPQRFQRRFGIEARGESVSRGLATLPEGEADPEEETSLVSTYQRVYPDRKPSLTVNTDVVSAMEAIEEVRSPVKDKFTWRRPSITTSSPVSANTQSKNSSPQITKEDGRRSLIESLGNQSKDEKLVLYIPEKSIISGSGKTLRRFPSLQEDNNKGRNSPENNLDTIGNAGTKEGFDRFSSIRRSRRYKKGPEAHSPTNKNKEPPTFTKIQPKFVSKVDITDDTHSGNSTNSGGVEAKIVCTGNSDMSSNRSKQMPASRTRARNDPRSASMIEPRHVHLALGRKSSNETDSSGTLPTPPVTTVGITRPIFAISTGTRDSSKGILNSTHGNTERDEGFEESQSSLSETNSQNESTVISGLNNKPTNSLNNKHRNTFRMGSNPLDTYHNSDLNRSHSTAGEKKLGLTLPLRKKSSQENSPTEGTPNYTNSSRTSLQGSRSSLTSQSTVNTVREFPDGKPKGQITPTKVVDSSSHPLSSFNIRKPFTSAQNGNNKHQVLSSRNVKNENLGNGHVIHTVSKSGSEKEKSPSKSLALAPRILSFMRPTASSSAKDKLDAPKVKGLGHKKSFK